MPVLCRQTAVWEGITGLPGYSNFYSTVVDPIATSAQDSADEIREFFSQLTGAIPGEVTVTVSPLYELLDDDSGDLVGAGQISSPPQVVQGTSGAGFSAQVGVLAEWLTGSFIAGRRLKGRTYLVPLAGQFDADGTLSGGGLALVTAALPYIYNAATNFVVWHRPVAGSGGSSSAITGGTVRDHAAILRSRMR